VSPPLPFDNPNSQPPNFTTARSSDSLLGKLRVTGSPDLGQRRGTASKSATLGKGAKLSKEDKKAAKSATLGKGAKLLKGGAPAPPPAFDTSTPEFMHARPPPMETSPAAPRKQSMLPGAFDLFPAVSLYSGFISHLFAAAAGKKKYRL